MHSCFSSLHVFLLPWFYNTYIMNTAKVISEFGPKQASFRLKTAKTAQNKHIWLSKSLAAWYRFYIYHGPRTVSKCSTIEIRHKRRSLLMEFSFFLILPLYRVAQTWCKSEILHYCTLLGTHHEINIWCRSIYKLYYVHSHHELGNWAYKHTWIIWNEWVLAPRS